MRPLGGQTHTHVTSILIRPCGGCQCDVAPNCCHRKLSNGKRKRRPCPSITLHSLVEWWHWHGGMAHFLLSPNPISGASFWVGGGRRSRRSNWFLELLPQPEATRQHFERNGSCWAFSARHRWVIGHLRDWAKPDLWTAINTFMVGTEI